MMAEEDTLKVKAKPSHGAVGRAWLSGPDEPASSNNMSRELPLTK